MPYSYTNRHGKTHYFRAVPTKYGKFRYYVTTSPDNPNLIEKVPEGFEVVESPQEAKVVIRKKKAILTTQEEREIVHDAIEELSAINDFFVHAEEDYLSVFHSQFNYAGGQEKNLNRSEAKEAYGEGIEQWMRFFTRLRFKLVDKVQRLFQTERTVHLGFFERAFFPIGEVGPIEEIAAKYGQHLGRESFFRLEPKDWGE